MPAYQVIIAFALAPGQEDWQRQWWHLPSTTADLARERYAVEANSLVAKGYHAVYLARDGVIVAQATS